MSGHSKWSTIKRAKGAKDAKRSAVFTKIAKLINIAARDKGGDLDTNFSLRLAVDKAKAANMPKDNIEKAIKRGTGELEGGRIEELIYEGIGPANSQFVLRVLTDNKNRSAANIRHLFSKGSGSLGSVMWNFEMKGVVMILKENLAEGKIDDEMELELIDLGAEDIKQEDEGITIYLPVNDLSKIKTFLEEKNINTESADIEYVAKEDVTPEKKDEDKIEKFIESLEDDEDVSDYYSNLNI
ncbi:MAG: YebC/PmpR family DNA-binding transcriptional regulator [Patescibacteria group bacterium]|jgi:YebC/PmpR family DNA-binding regulatory protein|nr:YebC/PmpR family DNA-binding transcriptional regulator [Patescibacteria group bacterium]